MDTQKITDGERIKMSENEIIIPPVKCQGIKTKLIPFIKDNVKRDENGLWIEPFVGSGSVVFNIQPKRALLNDKNRYIISLYQKIQKKEITGKTIREFLEYHGPILEKRGNEYYLEMRDIFNSNKDPVYFLFLNRSDFNGMIRFNRNGDFNVPFCQKPNRFSKAYITRICNQVDKVSQILEDKDWEFTCGPWQDAFEGAAENDYIYLDPPYIGRDTSYVGEWPEEESVELSRLAHETAANVCLSMWKEDEYRKNDHLYDFWSDFDWHECDHFYYIGAKESNRHPIMEVLAIKR